MIWFLVYGLFLLGLVVFFSFGKKFSLDDYIVFGRKGKIFEITMSLVALVFGASSVFGLAGWGYIYGLNGIWWTLSGAIFLIVLAFSFSSLIWRLKAYTISDVISQSFGGNIKSLSSLILGIAWINVLAGQIIAGANVINLVLDNRLISILVFISIFGLYTVIFGQSGPIKTSFFQVFLMILGLGIVLYFLSQKVDVSKIKFEMAFDEKFTFDTWFGVFLTVGLSYFFGPDIYSRIFSSGSEKVAKYSLLLSSFLIILISIIIVGIGICSRALLPNISNPDNIITLISLDLLPEELEPLLLVALVSIPLSGADVILITSTTLIFKDFLLSFLKHSNQSHYTSLLVFKSGQILILATAGIIAFWGSAIIPTLLNAYKIFSSIVVPMVFVSLLNLSSGRKLITLSGLKEKVLICYLIMSSIALFLLESNIITLGIKNRNLIILLINFITILAISIIPSRKNSISGISI